MKPSDLRQTLVDSFNESELRDIAFDLGIDYEIISGLSKRDKARELIVHVQRHGRLRELIDMIVYLRPNLALLQLQQIEIVPKGDDEGKRTRPKVPPPPNQVSQPKQGVWSLTWFGGNICSFILFIATALLIQLSVPHLIGLYSLILLTIISIAGAMRQPSAWSFGLGIVQAICAPLTILWAANVITGYTWAWVYWLGVSLSVVSGVAAILSVMRQES